MATRFWRGAPGDSWNGTAGSKWSATKLGATGASEPTSTDDVIFDELSGSSVVPILNNRDAGTLNCTGFTGTIGDGTSGGGPDPYALILPYGDVTLSSGMSLNKVGFVFELFGVSAAYTCAGIASSHIHIAGTGASTFTLVDNLITDSFEAAKTNVTVVTNNHSIATQSFRNSLSGASNQFGSSQLTLTGSGANLFVVAGVTGASTVVFTSTAAAANSISATGTLHKIEITGANAAADWTINGGAALAVDVLSAVPGNNAISGDITVATGAGVQIDGTPLLEQKLGNLRLRVTTGRPNIYYAYVANCTVTGARGVVYNGTSVGINTNLVFSYPDPNTNGLFIGTDNVS